MFTEESLAHHYFTVPNSGITYQITGSGSPLIFAHGLGGNLLSWWQQVPYFADNHTCITFSQRGFFPAKANNNTVEKINPDRFVDDLTTLINHLNLEKVSLIGQSMGGRCCLDYATRYPAKVTVLILSSSTGAISHESLLPNCYELRRWRLRAESAITKCQQQQINPAAGIRMAAEQPALHLLYQSINHLNIAINKEAIRAQLQKTSRPFNPSTPVICPMLLITGEEDIIFPPMAASALARLLPNSECHCIPKAGHSVYFERPQLFNSLVKAFLAQNL